MNVYREVGGSDAQRRLAGSASRAAAHLLGLPKLEVRWFREATDRQAAGDALMDTLGRRLGLLDGGGWLDDTPLMGLARESEPGIVWLHADLSTFDLVRTLGHEARHRHQYQQGVMDGSWSRDEAEADADRWSDLFMALLVAAGR